MVIDLIQLAYAMGLSLLLIAVIVVVIHFISTFGGSIHLQFLTSC